MDNHPPDNLAVLTSLAPARTMEIREEIDLQCVRVKQEIYKLRSLVEKHPHDENRKQGMMLIETAYNAFQLLQSFINSR